MIKTSRNHGIDLLRIACMLSIVLIHVLGHGGVLAGATSRLNHATLYVLKTFVQPAVDCFVLISGFVGYRGEKYYPRLKNILSLLSTVLFYSVSFAIIFKLIYPEAISLIDILKACIPTISKQYWFFTIYFGLMIVTPFLNYAVHKADKKQLLILSLAFAFFSCFSLIKDPFAFSSGYSVIWFIFLYLIGAIIKKYDIPRILNKKTWLLVASALLILIWVSVVVFNLIDIQIIKENSEFFLSNTSPFVVAVAICWLCLFSKINCAKAICAIIGFLTPSVFSVYLIHDNIYIRTYLISSICNITDGYSLPLLVLFVIGSVVAIFSCCILIDKVRIFIFYITRINKIPEKLEVFIKKIFYSIYNKIDS